MRHLAVTTLVLGALGATAFLGTRLYLDATTPDILSLADYRAQAVQMSRVYARDGRLIGTFHRERRTLTRG